MTKLVSSVQLSKPIYVPERDIVFEAVVQMDTHNSSYVLISDDAEQLVSILSERDIVRGLRRYGEKYLKMKIASVILHKALVIPADSSLEYAAKLMTKKRIRHLPIENGGKIVGVLTARNLIDPLYSPKAEFDFFD